MPNRIRWDRTRGALILACLLSCLLPRPALSAPRAAAECRAGTARVETLEGVGPRGEIRLASGARAVLDSLRWPEGEAEAARAWLSALRGRRLVLVPRGAPDRWGRERADMQVEDPQVEVAADGAPIDLAGGLIAAGLAFADAGEADALCRPALLAVEAGARARRLELWREPRPAAEDGPALRGLVGRFAVVEGRVRHVGERSARTYIDFAPRGGDGLTVTVSKRTWRTMAGRGLSAASLEGRRVRVRGLVELWRGPVIEAATVDAVEILEEAPAASTGLAGREERR